MEDLCLAEIKKLPRNYTGQTLKTSKHFRKQRTIKKTKQIVYSIYKI